jgi:putative hydrolase of the HAD superfamily
VTPVDDTATAKIRVVLFDYGGVFAEEGFHQGMRAIAKMQGHDPDAFFEAARHAVYETGYVVGRANEAQFWSALRRRYPLAGDDATLASFVLERFRIRPAMLEAVRRLRGWGIRCALLTDQTDWLDRLEARDHFFGEFDRIYNSYRLGKSKRDAGLFDDVLADLHLPAAAVAFIDDTAGHVERARSRGLQALRFVETHQCLDELGSLLGLALLEGAPG